MWLVSHLFDWCRQGNWLRLKIEVYSSPEDERDDWDSEDWEMLVPPDLETWWPEAIDSEEAA